MPSPRRKELDKRIFARVCHQRFEVFLSHLHRIGGGTANEREKCHAAHLQKEAVKGQVVVAMEV